MSEHKPATVEEAASEALEIVNATSAIRIIDQPTYDGAVALRVEAKRRLAGIEDLFENKETGIKTLAYRSYKNIADKQKAITDPINVVLASVNTQLVTFDREQERLRREEENRRRQEAERLERERQAEIARIQEEQRQKEAARQAEIARRKEEARKKAEEEAFKRAQEFEAAGMDKETIDAALEDVQIAEIELPPPVEAPVELPPPVGLPPPVAAPLPVAATYDKGKMQFRDHWVCEREDNLTELAALRKLVKAAAKSDFLLGFLKDNMPALNSHAGRAKDTFNVPGYKAVNKPVPASGRG